MQSDGTVCRESGGLFGGRMQAAAHFTTVEAQNKMTEHRFLLLILSLSLKHSTHVT